MRYCGDTGEDRVLMCSNAFRSVWLHHTHEGDVRLYCFIQQMCEAITHASTPLFQWLFDSVWVSRLVDSFLVPIWFVNKVTETNFWQGTGTMRSNGWMQKAHLAVWVGLQYMATCYFPLREEATSPSLTPSTHTPHHTRSACCLFVALAPSSNTIHAHTLWLQIHPRWYLETPNTIHGHTLWLQIPSMGIPCDFKYYPWAYLVTSNTIHGHTLGLQIPSIGIPCDSKYHPWAYLVTSNTIHGHTLRLQIPSMGIPWDFKYQYGHTLGLQIPSMDIPWDSRTRKVPVVFPGSNNILSASLRSKSNHHLHKKKHDVER